jgi:hypothetical protein
MNRRAVTTNYRARSLEWSISMTDHPACAVIGDAFADLATSAPASANHFTIAESQTPGWLALDRDGRSTEHPAADVLDRLIGFLNHGVRATATNTVDLHASAMTETKSGLTVVVAAPSGGGKTTLAAALCGRGWSYLSDETVGIDLTDGSLIGCNKPLTVKAGLHETLGLDLTPLTVDADLPDRWYVRPGLLGATITPSAPPPTDLVFVDFDLAAAGTKLQPVAPHHALMRLLPNTYTIERHPTQVLPTLARLVANARCWNLQTNDGTRAADDLLAAIRAAPQLQRELHLSQHEHRPESSDPSPAPGTAFAGFVGSGAVVHDYRRSQAVVLDQLGSLVWQLLDGHTTIDELAADLAKHFEAPAKTIAADVAMLCNELSDQGFLTASS